MSTYNGYHSRQAIDQLKPPPSLKQALLRNCFARGVAELNLSRVSEGDEKKRSELALALSKLGKHPARIKPSAKLESVNGKVSRSDSNCAMANLPEEQPFSSNRCDNPTPVHSPTDMDRSAPNGASRSLLTSKLLSNEPIMQGYLLQKSKYWFGKNKSRYVVLRPSGLEIYRDHASFQGGTLHSCHLLVGGRLSPVRRKAGSFSFASGKLTIRFIAGTEDGAEKWVQSLVQTIEIVTPGTSQRR
jgi:hypothetical protein